LKGKKNPKKNREKKRKDNKELDPMPGLTILRQTCSLYPI